MIFTVGNLVTLGIVLFMLIFYRLLDKNNRILNNVRRFAEKCKEEIAAYAEEKSMAVKNLGISLDIERKAAMELMKNLQRVTEEELAKKAETIAQIDDHIKAYENSLQELFDMTGRVQENLNRIRDESAFVESANKRVSEAKEKAAQIEKALVSMEKNLEEVEARLEQRNNEALEQNTKELIAEVKSKISDFEATAETIERKIEDHREAVNLLERERKISLSNDIKIVNETLKGAIELAENKAGEIEEIIDRKIEEKRHSIDKLEHEKEAALARGLEIINGTLGEVIGRAGSQTEKIAETIEEKLNEYYQIIERLEQEREASLAHDTQIVRNTLQETIEFAGSQADKMAEIIEHKLNEHREIVRLFEQEREAALAQDIQTINNKLKEAVELADGQTGKITQDIEEKLDEYRKIVEQLEDNKEAVLTRDLEIVNSTLKQAIELAESQTGKLVESIENELGQYREIAKRLEYEKETALSRDIETVNITLKKAIELSESQAERLAQSIEEKLSEHRKIVERLEHEREAALSRNIEIVNNSLKEVMEHTGNQTGKMTEEIESKLNEYREAIQRLEHEREAALSRSIETANNALKEIMENAESQTGEMAENIEYKLNDYREAIGRFENERETAMSRDMEVINNTLKQAIERAGNSADNIEEAALEKLREQAQERLNSAMAVFEEKINNTQEKIKAKIEEVHDQFNISRDEWNQISASWKKDIHELGSLAEQQKEEINVIQAEINASITGLRLESEAAIKAHNDDFITAIGEQQEIWKNLCKNTEENIINETEKRLEAYKETQKEAFKQFNRFADDTAAMETELRSSMQDAISRITSSFADFEEQCRFTKDAAVAGFSTQADSMRTELDGLEKELAELKKQVFDKASDQLKIFEDGFSLELNKHKAGIESEVEKYQGELNNILAEIHFAQTEAGVSITELRSETKAALKTQYDQLDALFKQQQEEVNTALGDLREKSGAAIDQYRSEFKTALQQQQEEIYAILVELKEKSSMEGQTAVDGLNTHINSLKAELETFGKELAELKQQTFDNVSHELKALEDGFSSELEKRKAEIKEELKQQQQEFSNIFAGINSTQAEINTSLAELRAESEASIIAQGDELDISLKQQQKEITAVLNEIKEKAGMAGQIAAAELNAHIGSLKTEMELFENELGALKQKTFDNVSGELKTLEDGFAADLEKRKTEIENKVEKQKQEFSDIFAGMHTTQAEINTRLAELRENSSVEISRNNNEFYVLLQQQQEEFNAALAELKEKSSLAGHTAAAELNIHIGALNKELEIFAEELAGLKEQTFENVSCELKTMENTIALEFEKCKTEIEKETEKQKQEFSNIFAGIRSTQTQINASLADLWAKSEDSIKLQGDGLETSLRQQQYKLDQVLDEINEKFSDAITRQNAGFEAAIVTQKENWETLCLATEKSIMDETEKRLQEYKNTHTGTFEQLKRLADDAVGLESELRSFMEGAVNKVNSSVAGFEEKYFIAKEATADLTLQTDSFRMELEGLEKELAGIKQQAFDNVSTELKIFENSFVSEVETRRAEIELEARHRQKEFADVLTGIHFAREEADTTLAKLREESEAVIKTQNDQLDAMFRQQQKELDAAIGGLREQLNLAIEMQNDALGAVRQAATNELNIHVNSLKSEAQNFKEEFSQLTQQTFFNISSDIKTLEDGFASQLGKHRTEIESEIRQQQQELSDILSGINSTQTEISVSFNNLRTEAEAAIKAQKSDLEAAIAGQKEYWDSLCKNAEENVINRTEKRLEEYKNAQNEAFKQLSRLADDVAGLEMELRSSIQEAVSRVNLGFSEFEEQSRTAREGAAAELSSQIEFFRRELGELEVELAQFKQDSIGNVSNELKNFEASFASELVKQKTEMELKIKQQNHELQNMLEKSESLSREEYQKAEDRIAAYHKKSIASLGEMLTEDMERLKQETLSLELGIRTEMRNADEARFAMTEKVRRDLAEIGSIAEKAESEVRNQIGEYQLLMQETFRQKHKEIEEKIETIAAAYKAQYSELENTAEDSRRLMEEWQNQYNSQIRSMDSAMEDLRRRSRDAISENDDRIASFRKTLDDIQKNLGIQTKIFDSTEELKQEFERRISEMNLELNRLDQRKNEIVQLESQFMRVKRLEDEVNAKMTRFLSEKHRIEFIENDFNRLLKTSQDVEEKLAHVLTADDILLAVQKQIKKLEDSIRDTEEKYERLQRKAEDIEETNERVTHNFKALQDTEEALRSIDQNISVLKEQSENLRGSIELLAADNERAKDTSQKLATLDETLSQIEKRIKDMNVARGWLARLETELETLNKDAQNLLNLNKSLLKEEGKAAITAPTKKKGKGAPPPQDRDNVKRLKRQGWSVEEIANALHLSKGEVELILELDPMD